MKVLVIGSGGREHALCWAIAASPLLTELYCAPGNGGIEPIAQCVEISPTDFDGILEFCQTAGVDFVVVGPEDPLVGGLVDRLDAENIRAFGPSAAAAQLEGSKGYTKDLCAEFGIPTAAYARFSEAAPAKAYIADQGAPIVVKADGLAAGKGVIVAETEAEADAAVDEIFAGRFGNAGAEVVIEEFLDGEEASFFALCDGKTALPLATAQDHKRAGDGDTGPNTGGMGAYSPAPVLTETMQLVIMDRIINPTLDAMAARGSPFKGVLYAGLMITKDGPKLIEYNVRFGDPECQVLMVRLKSDLLGVLLSAYDGVLNATSVEWHDEAALTVAMASDGYPGSYEKNTEIKGLDAAAGVEGVEIFHAGTRREGDRYFAVGGRVLNVTALGKSIGQAQARAYNAVDLIQWPEGFCRRDIGWRAIDRERKTA